MVQDWLTSNLYKNMKPVVKETKIEYVINAEGKTLGRVASDAASKLLGKATASYDRSNINNVFVKIENAGKLKITPKKMATQTYLHYTGFRGGLKETTLPKMIEKGGIRSVLEKTVDGMIPRNKLRKEIMKRLTVSE